MVSVLLSSSIVAVLGILANAAMLQGTDEGHPAFLVLGLLGAALLVWGLIKRLIKFAIVVAILGAVAWYFYLAPPS